MIFQMVILSQTENHIENPLNFYYENFILTSHIIHLSLLDGFFIKTMFKESLKWKNKI